MNSNEDIYLIEYFFWKDEWFNESPEYVSYGTKQEAIDYLNKHFEQNKNDNPELDLENMVISWSTSDDYRHWEIKCTKIPHVSTIRIL